MGADEIPYFGPEGFNCAESVFALMEQRGVITPPAGSVRLLTGFGGGMGRCLTCGAVTGGVAAIGCAAGRTAPQQTRAPSQQAVKRFLAAFQQRYGHLDCAHLSAGFQRKSPAMYTHCRKLVLGAADLAAEALAPPDNANETSQA